MNGLDLFSGIGGLTMALEPWVRPVAYCENDRYAQGVLLSRMRGGMLPMAPIWDEVRTLNTKTLCLAPSVDIIYGGFPCQDISIAGAGKGLDGSRSKLFFEVIRLVSEIRPRFVFLENVPAITVRGLDRVLLEFSALGFDCRWTIVSAGEMGACHLRERWWLCAHANGEGLQEPRSKPNQASEYRKEARNSTLPMVQSNIPEDTIPWLHGMDDGLPLKTHRIRALGNSVVPSSAREAFMRLTGLK